MKIIKGLLISACHVLCFGLNANNVAVDALLEPDSDKPTIQLHITQDYTTYDPTDVALKHLHTDKDDSVGIVMRASLVKIMGLIVQRIIHVSCEEERILREITGRNSKFVDLYIQATMTPGSKKCKKTANLRIVPIEDINRDLFQKRLGAIIPRFKQYGFDLDINIVESL